MSLAPEPAPKRRRRSRRAATLSLAILGLYLAVAYFAAPEFWTLYDAGRRPEEMVTTTAQGIPGDPINVGLVGSHADLLRAFAGSGWHPADAVTLRTAIDIGISVVLARPDPEAPVSPLFYEGRQQDFAFEQAVGTSADQRHHVRFWLTGQAGDDGRPLWLGAASFDRGVGFSHDTGQVTHHIGPDIDAERDFVMSSLSSAGFVASSYSIPGRGATGDGRNGGGDPYHTDGMATVGVLTAKP